MADAELHIHVNNPVDMAKLEELLTAAINAREDGEQKMMVPTGYRCVECYQSDGGHLATCSIYRQQKRQAENKS